MLSTVCVEAASVQQLGVRSLDAVNVLLVDQRPGVFIRLIDCWVSSESFREWMPFVEVHQILFLKWISLQCWVFWDEACQMVSLQWLEPFDACQWLVVSDRCLIAYSFCWDPSAFRCLRWISLLGNVLFLAICHWHWYHSCLSQLFGSWVHWWRRVPFGWVRQLLSSWSNTLCLWRCRKNRKPRLDFSFRCLTSFEAGLWTHQYCWVRQEIWLVCDLLAFWLLREVKSLDLSALVAGIELLSQYLSVFRVCKHFSGYLFHVCRFSCENLF